MKPSSHSTAAGRSIVHPGRFWFFFRKAMKNTLGDAAPGKRGRIFSRPPTVISPPSSDQPTRPSVTGVDEHSLENQGRLLTELPIEGADDVSVELPRLRPSRALRIFGFLGVAVIIVLTLVLNVLSYGGADGMVVELFGRVRMIVTVASVVALLGLVALAFRSRKGKWTGSS